MPGIFTGGMKDTKSEIRIKNVTTKSLARHSRNQLGKSFYHEGREGHEGLGNYFSELRALRVLRGEMDFSY
jgi:hypothetical protein